MYPKAISVVVVLLSVCAISVHGATNPNLKRRNFHSLAVLGDWLYIDGGSYSSWYPKDLNLTDRLPINSTYALPLTQPWVNGSVVFRETEYNGKLQTTDQFGLWTDGNNKMYKWGGSSTTRAPVNSTYKKTLYEFTADGNGRGTWAETSPGNSATFKDLRATKMGSAASCKGVGYYMGGVSGSWTEYGVKGQEDDDWYQAPGLLTYNMNTSMWANVSTDSYAMDGAVGDGRGQCVEGFGSDPLVLFLGGTIRSTSTSKVVRQNTLSDITFYNPVKQKWIHQGISTSSSPFGSATAPDARSQFCMAGARGKDGTYEIFVYGGYNNQFSTDLADVWILSLPAFRWFRAPAAQAPARRYHQCAVIGKSQMISVGGAQGNNPFGLAEVWPNGIGIMDMNTAEWADSYNPNAGEYDTPSFIKQYYQESDYSARVNWTDDEDFKNTFSGQKLFSTSNGESKDNDDNSNSNSKNPNIGAIVGGVIGGTALITLIVAVAWFMLRYRRSEQGLPKQEPTKQEHSSDYTGSQESVFGKSNTPDTVYSGLVYPNPIYEIHDARFGRPNVVDLMQRKPTPPPAEMVGV